MFGLVSDRAKQEKVWCTDADAHSTLMSHVCPMQGASGPLCRSIARRAFEGILWPVEKKPETGYPLPQISRRYRHTAIHRHRLQLLKINHVKCPVEVEHRRRRRSLIASLIIGGGLLGQRGRIRICQVQDLPGDRSHLAVDLSSQGPALAQSLQGAHMEPDLLPGESQLLPSEDVSARGQVGHARVGDHTY